MTESKFEPNSEIPECVLNQFILLLPPESIKLYWSIYNRDFYNKLCTNLPPGCCCGDTLAVVKWMHLCCCSHWCSSHKNAYVRISFVIIKTAIWWFGFLTFELWRIFETVLQYICPQCPNTYGMPPNWQSHGPLVLQLLWRMPAFCWAASQRPQKAINIVYLTMVFGSFSKCP